MYLKRFTTMFSAWLVIAVATASAQMIENTVPSSANSSPSTASTPPGGGGGTCTVTSGSSGTVCANSNIAVMLVGGQTTFYTAGPDMKIWTPHTGPSAMGSCTGYGVGVSNFHHQSFWNGSVIVAACSGGNQGLLFSADGATTWSNTGALGGVQWASVGYGNGIWVALPCSGTGWATSTNGTTWTTHTGFPKNWGNCNVDVLFDGTNFIATNSAVNSASTVPDMVYSPDGLNWTVSGSPPAAQTVNNIYSALACSTSICAILSGGDASGNGNAAWSSDHGVTWTSTTPSGFAAFSGSQTNLTWNGTAFVALRGGILARSTDGKVWSTSGQAASQNGTFINVVNGSFVAPVSQNNGATYTSSDGLSWVNTGNNNLNPFPTQPTVVFTTGLISNATTLNGCTWGSPCPIGSGTTNTGAFSSLVVGAGSTLNKYLEGSSGSLAFGTITQDTTATQTFALTGAATANSVVSCSPTAALPTGTSVAYAFVSSAGNVQIGVLNAAGNQAVTATFNCTVLQ